MNRRALQPDRSDRRGASLVLTVVLLLGVLAVLALAIDLGMLFTARAEAQRAADAAALAAASAFQEYDPDVATAPATERAVSYAGMNQIRNVPISPDEVTVQVVNDERLVRVWVRRDSLPTWFARLLGIPFAPVGAMAAAQAAEGGSARCLKPFALPDAWHDADDDTAPLNHVWDEGENWAYGDDPGDYYKPYTGPDGESDETGYGSAWRDLYGTVKGDYGRQIQLKYTDPTSEFMMAPSMFLPWRLPSDPDIEACTKGAGSDGTTGAAIYRRNICSCNNSSVELGVPYDIEPGNMLGPTAQGISELIGLDPGAHWDPTAGDGDRGAVVDSDWGANWLESPRVVRVAMFDPTVDTKSGMHSIVFNNFGLFFIEEQLSSKDPIVGRFLYYVDGDGEGVGPTAGSLVLYIRLVQ